MSVVEVVSGARCRYLEFEDWARVYEVQHRMRMSMSVSMGTRYEYSV